MFLGKAMAEYQGTRARVRWTTTFRLRRWERKSRERAEAGQLDPEGAVRLAAIRDELAARGERPPRQELW